MEFLLRICLLKREDLDVLKSPPSGNLGYSHSMINDLFMSTDGGVEWEEVLGGQYHYQILDHGGLVVAVRRGQLTDSLM